MILTMDVPAKLNLFLAVTGRRGDGYHTLASLFWPLAAPGDRLTFEYHPQGSGIELHLSGAPADVPCDRRNLVFQAAEKYLERAGHPAGHLGFTLCKAIPSAAGMGGGSSDAAAVLKVMQEAFGLLTPEELAETALSLGADVPYFLNPQPALVTGIGETVEPLGGAAELPPVLVVSPRFPVSAKWAYTHLDHAGLMSEEEAKRRIAELVAALENRDFVQAGRLLHNDLARALYEKFPLLTLCRRRLLGLGACGAEVTGSGSSLFAFFKDEAARDEASRILKEQYADGELGVLTAQTLPRPVPAFFLDRDGVINEEAGYLHDASQLKLIPGAAAAIARARAAGFRVAAVTNQSVVARGMGNEAEVYAVNAAIDELLKREGAAVDDWECCFHHPDFTGPCGCRKPRPGMLLAAARKQHLDLSGSVMIGDRVSDLDAGLAAGCRTAALVRTGYGEKTLAEETLPAGTPVFDDLAAAVDALIPGQ